VRAPLCVSVNCAYATQLAIIKQAQALVAQGRQLLEAGQASGALRCVSVCSACGTDHTPGLSCVGRRCTEDRRARTAGCRVEVRGNAGYVIQCVCARARVLCADGCTTCAELNQTADAAALSGDFLRDNDQVCTGVAHRVRVCTRCCVFE
jgi:hypothetical protein